MITDSLGDMLTRIRNAVGAKHEAVEIPHSVMKESIAKILSEEGFVGSVRTADRGIRKVIVISLKYSDRKKPVLREIRRVSRPGRRVYVGYREIPRYLSGFGTSILSTPQGVMSGAQARKAKAGGEWICLVS